MVWGILVISQRIDYMSNLFLHFRGFPERRLFKGMFKGTQLTTRFPLTHLKAFLLHSITALFIFYLLTSVLEKT